MKSPKETTVMKLHKRGLRYTFPLFTAVAGALMLMTAFAPRAEAAVAGLQYYFDFNADGDNAPPPYTSVAPATFGAYPTMQTTMFNDPNNAFPTGVGAGMSVQTGEGSTVNLFSTDTAGNALRMRSNATGSATSQYCFIIGPMNFTGLEDISISFALKGASGGGFTDLTMAYSFDNITYVDFATVSGVDTLSTYTLEGATLPTLTDNASTLYIRFCFTGSTNSGEPHGTFIDNIQISAAVPEPTTAVSGVLAVLAVFGLCWSQRRCLIQSLRFRRT